MGTPSTGGAAGRADCRGQPVATMPAGAIFRPAAAGWSCPRPRRGAFRDGCLAGLACVPTNVAMYQATVRLSPSSRSTLLSNPSACPSRADIETPAQLAVRVGGVPHDPVRRTRRSGDHGRELADRYFAAGADVERFAAAVPDRCQPERPGAVLNEQELTGGSSVAPARQLRARRTRPPPPSSLSRLGSRGTSPGRSCRPVRTDSPAADRPCSSRTASDRLERP